MSAWHDNISPAALQRITTLSAFNDPESKSLMLQTLYEELEKTIDDYKATNHELAQDYAELSKRAIKMERCANCKHEYSCDSSGEYCDKNKCKKDYKGTSCNDWELTE